MDGVVRLRPMSVEDAEVHLSGEDESTVRWLSGERSTIETVTAWIERNLRSLERGGPVRCFGIRRVDGDVLVGVVEATLDLPGLRQGVANISYGLYPHARGRRYATRAVELMCDYLVSETPAWAAVVRAHRENEASHGVPGRAGFRCVGSYTSPGGGELVTYLRRLRTRISPSPG